MKIGKVEYKLPKRFKAKWIKVLRSGEYKQGKGQLYNKFNNSYCCLGVAGSLCGVSNKKLDRELILDKYIFNTFGIPKAILGNVKKNEDQYNPLVEKLSTMNDSEKSFNYIASYIERYL